MPSLWSSRLAICCWKRKGGRKRERRTRKQEGKTEEEKTKMTPGKVTQWATGLQTPASLGDAQKTPRDGNMVETQLQGGTGLVWLLLGIQENFLFSVVDYPFHWRFFPIYRCSSRSHITSVPVASHTCAWHCTLQGLLLGPSASAWTVLLQLVFQNTKQQPFNCWEKQAKDSSEVGAVPVGERDW